MAKDAEAKTILAVQSNMKRIEKINNKMWACAHKAPMFSRKMPTKDGARAVTRTKRLVSAHSVKIMVAGSAMQCAARHRNELAKYGLKPQKESRSQPFVPSISPGAKMALEQWLAAYAQEGMVNAKTILTAAKVHKRMRPEVVENGFQQANESIFFAAAPVPQRTVVISLKKGGAKKGPSTKPSKKGGEADAEEDDPTAREEDAQGGDEDDQ